MKLTINLAGILRLGFLAACVYATYVFLSTGQYFAATWPLICLLLDMANNSLARKLHEAKELLDTAHVLLTGKHIDGTPEGKS